jgi:hypothetical protein
LDVLGKLVAVKVAVRHAATARKLAIAGMLASASIPLATGMQRTPAGEATTSKAKTPVAAGSVNKSGRKYRKI